MRSNKVLQQSDNLGYSSKGFLCDYTDPYKSMQRH